MNDFNFIAASINYNTFEKYVPAPYVRKVIHKRKQESEN